MSSSNAQPGQPPRMLAWALFSAALMVGAHALMAAAPGSLYAISLYKAHLLALGGWGGYWLDRALFPYARPHTYVADEPKAVDATAPNGDPRLDRGEFFEGHVLATEAAGDYPMVMLRRAIVVAACLVCVGLGS